MNTYFLCCIILVIIKSAISDKSHDALVITVASEKTDGYERYIRSAKYYGIDVQTLGMNTEWLGGDMNLPGGGYKVNLLREELKPFKRDDKKIIVFTDSFDVVFLSPLNEMIEKFKKTGAKILFGAEHYCWPDKTLKDSYPAVETGAKYLNSGMFMGYASSIYELLKTPIKNRDDDQLYFTNLYLNKEFRDKYNMKLDHIAEIFQNLNGALTEVELDTDAKTGEYKLKNLIHLTNPSVIHGNGLSKLKLNQFSNYIAGSFVNNECKSCNTDTEDLDENNLPIVTMAIFIEKPWPFFEEFLIQTLALDYPKNKIHLFVHNNAKYHEPLVNEFMKKSGIEYKSSKQVIIDDKIDEANARNIAAKYAMKKESDYLFVLDAEAHIDNQQVLRILIREKRGVIAPLMTRDGNVWSNFWGAISALGYYARSTDYMEIASSKLRGIWNVPFISACYLVEKSVMPQLSYKHEELDPDMAMCAYLREKNIFMHVLNMEHYGHLINGETFDTNLTRPDFYQLLTNKPNWEHRYIHPDYITELHPDTIHKQPCPDVYWLPIATERFCKDMIAIMEGFGKWSDGTNSDVRLQGGYEAVPTRDIHMNQVGLEPLWLQFLQAYVRPLQEQIFTGYFHNPPRSLMNFVVRYRPDEQPSLRPHHDSSTYTINIALNTPNVDYEGGGCHFLRYNCSVLDTKPGWMLMHPGRLTHFHEGLKVTKGTRYIMISFVDP